MGRAEISSGQGSSRNEWRRYRSTEDIDSAELRQQVSWWLDEHLDGTGEQMIADLSPVYPGYDPGELGIVLRAAHFAEKRNRQR
jgi:hypothetical protein